jgi:hypothetical protein
LEMAKAIEKRYFVRVFLVDLVLDLVTRDLVELVRRDLDKI